MKLTLALLACASASENATDVKSGERAVWDWCDLKDIPDLFVEKNGKFTFGDLYKVKANGKHPVTGERLQNPAQIMKGRGLMKRRNKYADTQLGFVDAWLVCKKNPSQTFKLKCSKRPKQEGDAPWNDYFKALSINDAPVEGTSFPLCDSVGCNPDDIPFTAMTDKCRYGVHDGLEVPGNKCFRQCSSSEGGIFTSERKIKCDCSGESCSYKIFVSGSWIAWDSTKPNGSPIISADKCTADPIPEDQEISEESPYERKHCVFPTYGKWPKRRHEQDGTKVDFGIECENQIVRDGYVLVPVGSKCSFGCQAKNGEAFRVATNAGKFQCITTIKKKFFREHGCTDKCVDDWVKLSSPLDFIGKYDESFNKQAGSSYGNHNWFVGGNSPLVKKQTCYKVIDTSCNGEPSAASRSDWHSNLHVPEAKSFDCPDGHGPGAACNLNCAPTTVYGRTEETGTTERATTCVCTDTCSWTPTDACVRFQCQVPVADSNSRKTVCRNSEAIDGVYTVAQGVTCETQCKDNYGHWFDPHHDEWLTGDPGPRQQAMCVCADYDHDEFPYVCKLQYELSSCMAKACTPKAPLWTFKKGYDQSGVGSEFMEEQLECDNVFVSDDSALNGKAVDGSDCYVKCKPGAEFKDDDIETNDRFVERDGQIMYRMTCDLHDGDMRMDWDIVEWHYDEYYDPHYYIYGGGKWDDYATYEKYPQCGPK